MSTCMLPLKATGYRRTFLNDDVGIKYEKLLNRNCNFSDPVGAAGSDGALAAACPTPPTQGGWGPKEKSGSSFASCGPSPLPSACKFC